MRFISVYARSRKKRLGFESLRGHVNKHERFIISFPLGSALRKKIIEKVGYYPAKDFGCPEYMRTPLNIRGEFLGWHIINTTSMVRELVNELSKEQKQLSPWGVWNDTLLVKRIVDDWTLENWTPWD